MNSFFAVLLGNLTLKNGPQDFPCSVVLMRLCLIMYFVTGLPGLLWSTGFEQAVLAMALDMVILMLFVYACLQAFSKPERYVQSVIGLTSVGSVFQLLVLPLLYSFDADADASGAMANIAWLFLLFFSWYLAVYSHVFRDSFSVRLPSAMILTVCYFVINVVLRKIFFPALTQ